MCDPITAVGDILATVTGNPELIPLINSGASLAEGKGLKNSLIAGGEALAGQELAGAVGIGEGNSFFNNALGITGDNPAGTGLPDIGKTIGNLFNSTGAGGSPTGISPSSTSAVQGAAPGTSQVSAAPATGGAGASAAGAAAPASVAQGFGPDATILDQGFGSSGSLPSSLNSAVSLANAPTGSSFTSSPNVGTGTTGTQGLSLGQPNTFSGFGSGTGGANIPGATESFGSAFTPATETPSSLKSFIDSPSFKNAGNVIASNPGTALSAGGLALDAIKGSQASSEEKSLKAEASKLGQQGDQLSGYLQSGNLPPGVQAGINQASESAKATIRSQYASRGMSGSSAEQQDLAAVDQRAQAEGANMAMQLLQTGISETGMASQLYQTLMGEKLKEDQGLSTAISNFATAAAGGGQAGRGGITVNYSGNA